jgi:co-chaperonin GroES (HSP10)
MTSFRRKRIGDIFVSKGLVTQEQINGILPKTDGTRIRLGELLVAEGLVSEEDLAKSLAEQRDLRYVDLMGFRIDAKFIETIPLDLMERYRFVPMEDSGELLVVAMADPNNLPAIDELEIILNRQVEICVSTPTAIEAVLKRSGGSKQELNAVSAEVTFPTVKDDDVLSFASFDKAKRPSTRHMHTIKNLIVVGDRVLIDPDEGMDRTPSGLYLPPTVKEKEKIIGGHVVKAGPGYPIPDTTPAESWASGKKDIKYLPLQAAEGDFAIFLKEPAMEIEFEEKKYLIVPHSAILALFRTEVPEEN